VFKKNITISEILKKYNILMLLFIFIVLTNFQKWYILWLLPTIIWQNKNMRRFIIYLTITALIPSMGYFMVQSDPFMIGMTYSIKILIFSALLLNINILGEKYFNTKNIKEKKCHV